MYLRTKGAAVFLAVAIAVVAFPAAAFGAIRIHKIRYDPPGADYQSNSQLRAEYIVVKNTGGKARQLRGWVVKDRAGHRFRFPRYRIPSGGYVKIHTGSGRDRRGDLYWGSGNFIWNNDGDKAALRWKGRTRDTCRYPGGASPNPPKYC
jgi:hypothetical protein